MILLIRLFSGLSLNRSFVKPPQKLFLHFSLRSKKTLRIRVIQNARTRNMTRILPNEPNNAVFAHAIYDHKFLAKSLNLDAFANASVPLRECIKSSSTFGHTARKAAAPPTVKQAYCTAVFRRPKRISDKPKNRQRKKEKIRK